MSDIRGRNPQGNPQDVGVTNRGELNVNGLVWSTGPISVPGIGLAAAYAAAQAFGTAFAFQVPPSGTISSLIFLDYADLGIRKDFALFSRSFVGTADKSAFAPSDADLRFCVGVVSVDLYYNWSLNQVGIATPALSYIAPEGRLWCQIITQGADNIPAGAVPEFIVVVV